MLVGAEAAACTSVQSTIGSVKFTRWPEASQTRGYIMIADVETDDIVALLHHRRATRRP